jgi:hypothetical protein
MNTHLNKLIKLRNDIIRSIKTSEQTKLQANKQAKKLGYRNIIHMLKDTDKKIKELKKSKTTPKIPNNSIIPGPAKRC